MADRHPPAVSVLLATIIFSALIASHNIAAGGVYETAQRSGMEPALRRTVC
jgi:hypothetical protein